MTVQELIDKLNKVEDKTREVLKEYPTYYDDGDGYMEENFETVDVCYIDVNARKEIVIY